MKPCDCLVWCNSRVNFFSEEAIDGEVLADITDEELKSIVKKLGWFKKVRLDLRWHCWIKPILGSLLVLSVNPHATVGSFLDQKFGPIFNDASFWASNHMETGDSQVRNLIFMVLTCLVALLMVNQELSRGLKRKLSGCCPMLRQNLVLCTHFWSLGKSLDFGFWDTLIFLFSSPVLKLPQTLSCKLRFMQAWVNVDWCVLFLGQSLMKSFEAGDRNSLEARAVDLGKSECWWNRVFSGPWNPENPEIGRCWP